jgi:hypothetical protein
MIYFNLQLLEFIVYLGYFSLLTCIVQSCFYRRTFHRMCQDATALAAVVSPAPPTCISA